MKLLVIDGQGGRLGKQVIELVRRRYPDHEILAVGTNAVATAAMLKGGADAGATGENPVAVACRDVDIIVGPVGIVIADALLGEVTPRMAVSVAQSRATRILIPMNRCDNLIAGVDEQSLGNLVEDAVQKIGTVLETACAVRG